MRVEGRGMVEGRGLRVEGRKSEVRGQRSEVRFQTSNLRSRIRNHESGIGYGERQTPIPDPRFPIPDRTLNPQPSSLNPHMNRRIIPGRSAVARSQNEKKPNFDAEPPSLPRDAPRDSQLRNPKSQIQNPPPPYSRSPNASALPRPRSSVPLRVLRCLCGEPTSPASLRPAAARPRAGRRLPVDAAREDRHVVSPLSPRGTPQSRDHDSPTPEIPTAATSRRTPK